MKLTDRLPSPAMIVALVALVAAIGGSAYAATTINGNQIKPNTVTASRSRSDRCETVPRARSARTAARAGFANSAGTATSATSATDAQTVGGQAPEDLRVRWLLLNEQGQIAEQSGGFTVLDAYDTNTNAYIDAGESLVRQGPDGHGRDPEPDRYRPDDHGHPGKPQRRGGDHPLPDPGCR